MQSVPADVVLHSPALPPSRGVVIPRGAGPTGAGDFHQRLTRPKGPYPVGPLNMEATCPVHWSCAGRVARSYLRQMVFARP